ncbi:hypothetical protein Dimus_005865 [Dionaea muscipula]
MKPPSSLLAGFVVLVGFVGEGTMLGVLITARCSPEKEARARCSRTRRPLPAYGSPARVKDGGSLCTELGCSPLSGERKATSCHLATHGYSHGGRPPCSKATQPPHHARLSAYAELGCSQALYAQLPASLKMKPPSSLLAGFVVLAGFVGEGTMLGVLITARCSPEKEARARCSRTRRPLLAYGLPARVKDDGSLCTELGCSPLSGERKATSYHLATHSYSHGGRPPCSVLSYSPMRRRIRGLLRTTGRRS